MKTHTLALLCSLLAPGIVNAATFNIGASSEVKFTDKDGFDLTSGSILQVGYFDIDSSVNPSSYNDTNWNSFTAILGIASLNPGKSPSEVRVLNFEPAFPANFDFSVAFDSNADPLSNALGKRLGIRIFDTTNASATPAELLASDYNTFASSNTSWILPNESGGSILSPSLVIIDDPASTATLSWQFGSSSAFQTVIPEPSSSLALLIGSVLLLGKRRR